MSSWQPDPQALQTVVAWLQAAVNSRTNEEHRNVQAQLTQFSADCTFLQYLAFIFGNSQYQTHDRHLAGLTLKNVFTNLYKAQNMTPEVLQYVQTASVSGLLVEDRLLRSTAGTLVSRIVMLSGLQHWPSFVPDCVGALQSQQRAAMEGVMDAMQKITEDCPEKLDSEETGRALTQLIPIWLSLTNDNGLAAKALSCLNNYVYLMPGALQVNLNTYLERLSALIQSSDLEVRKLVCEGLISLVSTRLDVIYPHLDPIIGFFIKSTQDEDEEVALAACEFWKAICLVAPEAVPALEKYLPQIIPILLSKMILSEEEIMELTEADNDASVPDRPEDVAPRFHKSKTGNAFEDDDEEQGDGDDGLYTIRKCAAYSLDLISEAFRSEVVLPILTPLIDQLLNNPDWQRQESALLALGCIAAGAMDALQPYLDSLYPMLMSKLQDEHIALQVTAAWSMSQYADFVCQDPSTPLFAQSVKVLLERMLARNKKVQAAACSGFAVFSECAGEGLLQFIPDIVKVFVTAMQNYQANNQRELMDAIATLFESVGAPMGHPDVLQAIMPPLLAKWNATQDMDDFQFLLLEAFTAIATNVGTSFAPFASRLYARCLEILEITMVTLSGSADAGEDPSLVDRRPMACALDLIAGMAEGLGENFRELVGDSKLMELVGLALQDTDEETLRSTLALLGDTVIGSPKLVEPHVANLIPLMEDALMEDLPGGQYEVNVDKIYVTNNACWAIGEFVLKFFTQIRPFAGRLVAKMLILLHQTSLEVMILRNAAICLGRLAMFYPEVVVQAIDQDLFITWCVNLKQLPRADESNAEKEEGYKGLCQVIRANPSLALENRGFGYVSSAMVEFDYASPELRSQFAEILTTLKSGLVQKGDWARVYSELTDPMKKVLQEGYNISA